MQLRYHPIPALIGYLVLTLNLGGALSFDSMSLLIVGSPGQTRFHADFEFVNGSNEPVSISRIESSCECASTRAIPERVEAGQRGAIKVEITLARSEGNVTRTVQVFTVGNPEQSYALTITVQLPGKISAEPGYIIWRASESPGPKQVRISSPSKLNARLVSVRDPKKHFRAESVNETANSWIVTVTPIPATRDTATDLEMDFEIDGVTVKRVLSVRRLVDDREPELTPLQR